MKLFFSEKRIKYISVLNISLQLMTPLASIAVPSAAIAAEKRLTRTYILLAGESADLVAKKFNIPVSELQKLNQFRTFSKGFISIGEGDEIDVPLATTPATQDSSSSAGDEHEAMAASLALGAGNFFQSNPDSRDALNLTRSLATSKVSEEIQAWLGKKGTAKINLNTDERLSLKGSSLDLLLPVYENPYDIYYTQMGIREKDDRTTANIGGGIRHFADGYMIGGNLFYDHDLTGNHSRLGVGAEYWRDYLKLSTNAYLRLSGWKDSRDLEDYEERVANGWDIRAEGFLPSYPQLGGKMVFEQYYGDKVGLFGHNEDELQKNPYAVTAGIIYTPIPLISLNTDYKSGKQGKSETSLGMNVNYSFGVPLKDQLNSDAIALQRSLAGSRYDLVDRNNNIVLEYRKKEVIRLRTAALVTGNAGETKSLEVSVTANHGLQEIQWTADTLFAQGGKIIHDGGDQYSVVLPVYRPQEDNSHVVIGVAVDKKGNRSAAAETQVTVLRANISATRSEFTPSQVYLPADGTSIQTFTLVLRDEQNNPVPVSPEQILLNVEQDIVQKNKSTTASVSAFREVSPGVYEVDVTAGTTEQSLTLTPVVEGVSLSPAKILIGGNPAVSALTITGTLDVGQDLNGTYTFAANGGEPTDKSLFAWGYQGQTAGSVAGSGTAVT
ncbi:inverse autotransporter beta domain-containing protein, partial [Enterobacter kobei]|uniref:inverse autotransporter beta domain-containing protein n=1 Tax=Enterobacter kobei TaxID=208224 RepID=UPI00235E0BEA